MIKGIYAGKFNKVADNHATKLILLASHELQVSTALVVWYP